MSPGAGERNHFQPCPRSLEIRRCGKIVFDLLLIGAASKSSSDAELEKRRPKEQRAQECQVNVQKEKKILSMDSTLLTKWKQ